MSTATWPFHNLRQTLAVSSPRTARRLVGIARSRERGYGGAMERALFDVRLLRRTIGPRQLRQPQRQRRITGQFLKKPFGKLAGDGT